MYSWSSRGPDGLKSTQNNAGQLRKKAMEFGGHNINFGCIKNIMSLNYPANRPIIRPDRPTGYPAGQPDIEIL